MKKQTLYILVGSAVIVFILVAISAGIYIKNLRNNAPAFESVAMPTMVATASTPTLVPTPLPTLTATLAAPGNIWVVTSIEPRALHVNGFDYDVAVFTNLNQPLVTIRAQCAGPSWPSPEIGHQYYMNNFEVLVPVEGNDSPLQRFHLLHD